MIFFVSICEKEIMKNLFWLICVLSLSYSCKQTQLAISNNKKSNKIYTKSHLSLDDIDFVSKEKEASKPSRSIVITKTEKKQIYSIENSIKDELFADVSNKPRLIKNKKRIHQNLIKIDSALKSQATNLENEEEVLDLSKKAKKYNLISLINLFLTSLFSFVAIEFNDYNAVLALISISGINTFIFSVMSLYFFLKTIIKIKKSGKKFKETDVTIKKNLRLALFSVFLCLIPITIVLIVVINIMINGIDVNI
jgi:hypothetical protein